MPTVPIGSRLVSLWRRAVPSRRIVLHGVRLATAARALDAETRRRLRRGEYQRDKLRQLASKVEPNDSFVDVGAGLGLTALFAASIVGDENVVAVEADPQAAAAARANFALNDRSIRLLDGAAANAEAAAADGSVAFYPNASFGASACFPRAGSGSPVRVPRVDLASLLAEREATVANVDAVGCECDIVTAVADFGALRVLMLTIHEPATGYERCVALVRHLFENRFALDFAHSSGPDAVFVRLPGPADRG